MSGKKKKVYVQNLHILLILQFTMEVLDVSVILTGCHFHGDRQIINKKKQHDLHVINP